MAKKIVLNPLRLEFKNYLNLLKLSILKPHRFALLIPEGGKYQDPLTFFVINFCIYLISPMIVNAVAFFDPQLVFLGVSSTLFSIPIGLLLLFIISLFFLMFTKILGGKGSFKNSLNIISYASLPLIFSWIPLVSFIFFGLSIAIMIMSYSRLFRFSKIRAGITILVPVLIVLVLLIATGVIQIPRSNIL